MKFALPAGSWRRANCACRARVLRKFDGQRCIIKKVRSWLRRAFQRRGDGLQDSGLILPAERGGIENRLDRR